MSHRALCKNHPDHEKKAVIVLKSVNVYKKNILHLKISQTFTNY